MFGVEIVGSISIGPHSIEVLKFESHTLYRRITDGKHVKELLVDPSLELRLVPIYPVFYPRFLTQYILCKFEKPITVAPGNSVLLYIEIPIDAAIYAYNKSSFTILDILPLHTTPKLILYGPLSGGVLARYCIANIRDHLDHRPRLGIAIAKLTIRNNTKSIATVNKILLDASPLRLYYIPNDLRVYTQEITMNIVSSTSAIVSYGQPFVENAKPIDDPHELKPPRIYNRTDMLWGY